MATVFIFPRGAVSIVLLLCSVIPRLTSSFSLSGVTLKRGYKKGTHTLSFSTVKPDTESTLVKNRSKLPPRKLLVYWRGEDVEGYSMSLRHPEFLGALSAVTNIPLDEDSPIHFENALKYDGDSLMPDMKLKGFNEAMQWVTLSSNAALDLRTFSREALSLAVSRCALINTVYEVVAEGESYEELCSNVIDNGGFDDMMKGGENEEATWALRVRHYGDLAGSKKETRYSSDRARSTTLEKKALLALKPMLLKLGGSVDLMQPDTKIYVFDGLKNNANTVLARTMASGHPKVFSINPNTRICVTTTPLEPIASYSLCNIAGVSNGQRIFDPYSGSCAILLAAALIAPNCQTVGVDISHEGHIDRSHIRDDFSSRGLNQPKAVIEGDCTEKEVRSKARAAVGHKPFDHIITDPPYGIREKMDTNALSPLEDLFQAIQEDRDCGERLLKQGGKLVCFVPCHPDVNLVDVLPSLEKTEAAGMKFLLSREQPLNSNLSRWLVSYECIR